MQGRGDCTDTWLERCGTAASVIYICPFIFSSTCNERHKQFTPKSHYIRHSSAHAHHISHALFLYPEEGESRNVDSGILRRELNRIVVENEQCECEYI